MAEGPEAHSIPLPHEYQEESVETDSGRMALTRCAWCHRTRNEIEAAYRG
jgi:hypothetical protein